MAEEKYTEKLNALQEELKGKIPTDAASAEDALAWLTSDEATAELDDQLALCMLLLHGTPKGLAEYEAEVDELMENPALLKAMLIADGAKGGKYGNAMKIWKQIQEQRTAPAGECPAVLEELALAIALEHAQPIMENDTAEWGAKDPEKLVDPVQRYLNYEQAFLNGELDDNFHLLDAWSLRMVVDGDEPDAIAAWGRKMLRNFRPDHILPPRPDERRYVMLVRTEVQYGSARVKYDKPEMQFYQNILMNGGICGRRAWFGRFILRCFGMPTTARPSKGHAALAHWTRKEWVITLGGGWGCGWTKTPYKADVDFKASTEARRSPDFIQVQRARWIGDLMDEKHKILGEKVAAKPENEGKLGVWYGAAIAAQKALIEGLEPVPDECPACPVPSMLQKVLSEVGDRNEAKQIVYNEDGSIVIPAAGHTNKSEGSEGMYSFRPEGGLQLFMSLFNRQGQTLLRGGTWKNGAAGCASGSRMVSAGFGHYHNWGFRVALSGPVIDKDDSDDSDDNADDATCPAPTKIIKLADGVDLELIYISPGTNIMGHVRPAEKESRFFPVEVPKHEIEITQGYYIGKYPVTQAQFEAMMGNNPSKSTREPNCPVDNISEQDAFDFCDKFSENAGGEIRLPTEAEWEFACRAGTRTEYYFGDDPAELGDYAWFKDNSGGKSHPVGEKQPNAWGLYDMLGNVCERVSDVYQRDYYANSPKQDPTGPSPGTSSDLQYTVKVEKGGKYTLTAEVVTMNEKQRLMLAVHDEEIELEFPFTLGEWGETTGVEIDLDEGDNELHFWRDSPPQYGVAVKNFILKPVE